MHTDILFMVADVIVLVYYFRAREFVKDDPLLEFSIGLAYLHRAMQRQANNRHHLILEATTFLFRYRALYIQKSHAHAGTAGAVMRQAAEFNIGRAFHQLGLFTLAMRYYERAIKVSEQLSQGRLFGGRRDLVAECAHNMCLIYALSGNMAGVKAITERYLVL
jgi:general transcription factor 3C polypeptide 3 (transcription factor C subunit 4)